MKTFYTKPEMEKIELSIKEALLNGSTDIDDEPSGEIGKGDNVPGWT